MLSLFPQFFDYSVLSVFVLRVCVAVVFLWEGYIALRKQKVALFEISRDSKQLLWSKKIVGILLLVGSIFLFLGFFTQIAAILLSIVTLFKGYGKRKETPEQTLPYHFLLFIVALSFLFLGPGLWSFDYPL